MRRRYYLYAVDEDGKTVLLSTAPKNQDELQEAQALMAEQMAEDFLYAEEAYAS